MPRIELPRHERFMPEVCVVTGATSNLVWKDILVSDGKLRLPTGTLAGAVVQAVVNADFSRGPVHVPMPFTEDAYRAVRLTAFLKSLSLLVAVLVCFGGLIAVVLLVKDPMPYVALVVAASAVLPLLVHVTRRRRSIELVDPDAPHVVFWIPSEAAAHALGDTWTAHEAKRRERAERARGDDGTPA